MRMYQVDAFTDQLFSGNPAAVLVLEDWLPDGLMLDITRENNLAETAFVKPRQDGAWDLRWFAPAHEVDFCGHATLATAHILFTEQGVSSALVFHTVPVNCGCRKRRRDIASTSPACLPNPTIALDSFGFIERFLMLVGPLLDQRRDQDRPSSGIAIGATSTQ